MFSRLLSLSFLYGALSASVAAQNITTVVCVAGQCLEGYTNTTLGATLSAPGAPSSLLLLPGEYTSATNPQLLHDVLTSSGASLTPSPGFAVNSSISLPLNLALQPGIAAYPSANFSGSASFFGLPNVGAAASASQKLSSGSLALSSNVWAAISAGTGNGRVIFWDSVSDISQLPANTFSDPLTLVNIQSSACSPACSGAGVCSTNGTCVCPTGFTGSSCEECASGFFGSTCQPCPAGCTDCDQGISGTGKCLAPIVSDPPSSCNCINGECGSNGECSCLPGWTTASNGTACAQCAAGYFLDSSGQCSVCSLGCAECAASTGDCITCKSGFTQNANDATSCVVQQSTTSSGTVCPSGGFSNGTSCEQCSPLCQTCTGPTSNDCIICGSGTFSFNGSCVETNSNGVCQGSNLVANNNKYECDTCPNKCTTCEYQTFTTVSTTNQLQCTGCLPGYFLSDGQCVSSCPTGTFVSTQDNLTCTACDSSCGTCVDSSTFCLTCSGGKLADNGTCVSSCASNTFSSGGSCLACHPDCATCSGSGFNQCSSCDSNLPVLTSGRCLPTCSQNQYFDTTSSSCQSCDSSCSSCSGGSSDQCLACSITGQVLRGGSCVAANCASNSTVVAGLGLCLSDLVQTTATASGTSSLPPLPSITGLSAPVQSSGTVQRLTWWQILLMALGCAFIFVAFLICWRRRMRRVRAADTARFASAKRLNAPSWRMRLIRFGERLFGHRAGSRWMAAEADQDVRLEKMRAAEEARHDRDIEKLIPPYRDYDGYSHAGSSRSPSPLPSLRSYRDDSARSRSPLRQPETRNSHRLSAESISAGSLYTQITGHPRRGPEPRQPVKNAPLLGSRWSDSTHDVSSPVGAPFSQPERAPTPAQEYAMSMAQRDSERVSYWLKPNNTGGSNSKNPFLRQ